MPVMTVSRPTGKRTSTFFEIVRGRPRTSSQLGRSSSEAPRAARRMAQRIPQAAAGLRIRVICWISRKRALRDDFAAVHAGARAEIDDVIRAPHRLLVVLDDDERISLFAQSASSVSSSRELSRGCRPMVGSSST